jgi:hypothetical protein
MNCAVLTKDPSIKFHSEEGNLLLHTLKLLATFFFHNHVEMNIEPSVKSNTFAKSTTLVEPQAWIPEATIIPSPFVHPLYVISLFTHTQNTMMR